ncbi:uncharacterized protein BJ212DRAFT_1481621 [Suillus subaureus]|uniref:Uncharacterized protein n=1 Tax=Suillus subaureus TaxID=48587 RepID=A0A9P7EAA1_9AGAM|nr:uncharacterized protein BJ212DRAFT_1481621 [Suillus subaureus]KAG1815093.1 hypothetical protein BJ212DRAFT_1481621 [Suillus subaureus]
MEGKGNNPPQMKKPFKKDIAAVAMSDAAKSKTPSSPTQSDSDLACAIIEEILDDLDLSPSVEDIACIMHQIMSTILDSGTTSTLITDQEFFWTFSTDSHVTIKTANHSCLPTSGCGDCIADLSIGVSYMVEKGWAVNFLPGPTCCQLIFQEKCIGEIPMTGKLVFLDLQFVHPTAASSSLPCELSAFAHVPLM